MSSATPCLDRSHSPRLFGNRWVCPDCTPHLACSVSGCPNRLKTVRNAKALLASTWTCPDEHDHLAGRGDDA